ncbi:MAG: thioredoxin family protein [Chitinophagales bacterium]|nr:thioredoxin family protein [Chitinophagaceae bacterium]MCB9063965.1 thioredoxin family protein [Chitinophagales bacterium]
MSAQSYKKYTDEDTKELIYKGKMTFADLQKEPEFKWYRDGVSSYTPNAEEISTLKPVLKNYTFVVIVGTWCSDTHDILPKFRKVLQACNYPAEKVTMYGVDIEKKSLNKEEEKYHLKHVPTIIVYKDGFEVSRIVESLNFDSVEADLVHIIFEESSDDSSGE